MRYSKMDKKLTVKRITTERTDTGGIKEGSRATVFTTWCHLEPQKGARRVDYGQHHHTTPYDVYISNRPEAVYNTDLIFIDDEEYNITEPPYTTPDKRFIVIGVER